MEVKHWKGSKSDFVIDELSPGTYVVLIESSEEIDHDI
ncbi:MAG: hypothetical protein ACJAZC_000286 [Cryomorphaceae bacterium]|jgi:hypothetical protein